MFWARSVYDGVLWLVTFLATVLLDVDIGLGVGVGFSILIILIRSSIPSVALIENREVILRGNPGSENFQSDDKANIKEMQVKGPLNFITLCYVKTLIQLQLDSAKSPVQRKGLFKKNKVIPSSILKVNIVDELKEDARITKEEEFIQTRRLCSGPDSSGESEGENMMIETVGPPAPNTGETRIILNLSP